MCKKNSKADEDERELLKRICDHVAPEHLIPTPSFLIRKNGIHIGIMNPTQTIWVHHSSFCLGRLMDKSGKWYRPGSPAPDGTFALFRSNAKYVELVSDIVASRTIWYYHSDELFVASTSQRMLIAYLGSYVPNTAVSPWMLSSGVLGPGQSWDQRVKSLPGDSRLTLNRLTWQMDLQVNRPVYASQPLSDEGHREQLKQVIDNNFASIHYDYSKWLVPLSGGRDSRTILMYLSQKGRLKTLTWGTKADFKHQDSDAAIAGKVARYYHSTHTFYKLKYPETVTSRRLLERFLNNGEGRVDRIEGYLDGFRLWKWLHLQGVQGVIRGDEAFGWKIVSDERQVLLKNGIRLLSEMSEVPFQLWGMETNTLPTELKRYQHESLALWRDRLYEQFRHPTILAALNDLKLAYVEISNPLLSRQLLQKIRTVPDEWRTTKRLFRSIMTPLGPDIPIARGYPNLESERFFNRAETKETIRNEIQNSTVLSAAAIKFLLDHFDQEIYVRLGFRVYILTRMRKILEKDAQLLR